MQDRCSFMRDLNQKFGYVVYEEGWWVKNSYYSTFNWNCFIFISFKYQRGKVSINNESRAFRIETCTLSTERASLGIQHTQALSA